MLDVTTRYLQSVEAGKENLTLTTMVRITAALRVDVAALLVVPASREKKRAGRPKRVR